MTYKGVLKKMMTVHEEIIQYYLDMGADFLNVNQLLERNITMQALFS